MAVSEMFELLVITSKFVNKSRVVMVSMVVLEFPSGMSGLVSFIFLKPIVSKLHFRN